MTVSKHYVSAANATSAVLAQSATFTRKWYLAQPGMTPCFWRFASKLGMLADADYSLADGDKVGDKGHNAAGRPFLLAVVPAPAVGKRHKRADKHDAGDPYMLSPIGRLWYGKMYKAACKADADATADAGDDTDA